ncbi:uncharacterized protein LOC131860388 [Cryptomeria japonica]|uniref:uncharacterized protein LOC131860388 n=1 Tax=Cryptomeria japonica TaxID=3369 RepID=UPI0027D9D130|nr:uncharacterized protein LOC131860388 [Cryptomeria japonica]
MAKKKPKKDEKEDENSDTQSNVVIKEVRRNGRNVAPTIDKLVHGIKQYGGLDSVGRNELHGIIASDLKNLIEGRWKTALAIEKEHKIKALMQVQHELDYNQANLVVEECEAEEEIEKEVKQGQDIVVQENSKGKDKETIDGFDEFIVEDIIGDVISDIPNLTKDAEMSVEKKSIVETIDIDDTLETEKKKAKLPTSTNFEVEAEEEEEETKEEEGEDSVIDINKMTPKQLIKVSKNLRIQAKKDKLKAKKKKARILNTAKTILSDLIHDIVVDENVPIIDQLGTLVKAIGSEATDLEKVVARQYETKRVRN